MQAFYTKKKRLKKRIIRQIANDYLTNISLDGTLDYDLINQTIDTTSATATKTYGIDKNDFNIFLKLNSIKTNKLDEQTEYFKLYKQKQLIENPFKNKLQTFLLNEFQTNDVIQQAYIVLEANNKIEIKCAREQQKLQQIDKDKKENGGDLVHSENSDGNLKQHANEQNKYVKQKIQRDKQQQFKSNSAKSTTKPNGHESILKNSWSKSSELDSQTDLLNNSVARLTVPTSLFHRTISESSSESVYQQHQQRMSLMKHQKKNVQSLLKRMNEEKVLFIANNSVIGLFARIPFSSKPTILKQDLNDSLQASKQRHLPYNKSYTVIEQFIGDVFDYFDLDYYEYLNSDLMSFEYLIESKVNTKPRITNNNNNEEAIGKEQFEQQENDEINDSLSDKDEFDIKFVQNLHKRGRFRKRTISVDTTSTVFNERKYKYKAATYEANYLDDPMLTELTAGKNRTCLKFASYSVSIIDYVKPLELKKEINETFKEKFPLLQISLTKLRSIKSELYEIINECLMDVIIVAQSYVYFERLILQGLINKANRKHLAGSCLLIAAKLNDLTKKEINRLIDAIVQKFRLDNRKDLISFEFPILIALEFDLTICYEKHLKHHYERITNSSYIRYNKKPKTTPTIKYV